MITEITSILPMQIPLSPRVDNYTIAVILLNPRVCYGSCETSMMKFFIKKVNPLIHNVPKWSNQL